MRLRLLVLVAACAALGGCITEKRPTPHQSAYGGAPAADPGGYWCHVEQSQHSSASVCRPTYDACEAERQAANAQGLQTSFCAQRSPVACFQLGGQPGARAEWCAESMADCQAWLRVDAQKNGSKGTACVWKH